MTARPRVLVTDMELACSLGKGVDQVWPALLAGREAIGPISKFDTSAFRVGLSAEAKEMACMTDFEAARYSLEPLLQRQGASSFAGPHCGLVLGMLGGDYWPMERRILANPEDRTTGMTQEISEIFPPHQAAATLATKLAVEGPVTTVAAACASGNHALSLAGDWIREGRVDRVLAGGVNVLSVPCFAHFHGIRLLAKEHCRPFDKNRDGLVAGTGSAWILLESESAAKARGAEVLAEFVGWGHSCDAHTVTAPHPEARGAIDSIQACLADGRIAADQIDYVSAHGTGTGTNDRTESKALYHVFGSRAATLPMSSIKSMIGHTMGASAVIEAIACIQAIRTGQLPPTANFEQADPECPVNCLPNQAGEAKVRYALNASYGFGGNNSITLFGPTP
ncbi:MAG: beta-ketoacyl-[acyl-carrier-protein] synthase family protein [Planctomycetota bacterium]|nr:MAG: beta-ketoacyl-[acyl-carrier-protein] synthase family protein [Planctomycetota bacterium]